MRAHLAFAAMAALVVAINYGFALAGEPRNAWLFCDVLRACG